MWNRLLKFVEEEATFYRLHLLSFTTIPLLASAIFYASNGEYHVSYLDSLFLCYSAMTVTGIMTSCVMHTNLTCCATQVFLL